MYLPSLIFETMPIKLSMCEHKGVLKFIIRHLYLCEMKKATTTSTTLPKTLLKRVSMMAMLEKGKCKGVVTRLLTKWSWELAKKEEEGSN